MQWVEVTIRTTTLGSEAMSQVLFDEGVTGVSIEDMADVENLRTRHDEWDYMDEDIFSEHGNVVYVRGYFMRQPSTDQLVNRIMEKVVEITENAEEGFDVGLGEVLVKMVEEEDWSESWKQYYKPIEVGDRLVVKPEWEDYENREGRVVVELDPGAAFGTGQHETTLMCLELGEQYVRENDEVLDIGCGTGILGISAVMLGAKHALCIDRDEIAVSAGKRNARLNYCDDRVELRLGDLAKGVKGKYDVIFANIVADVIIEFLPAAKKLMNKNAHIIASGIIRDRESDVLKAAESCGLVVGKRLEQGEWIALVLQKK